MKQVLTLIPLLAFALPTLAHANSGAIVHAQTQNAAMARCGSPNMSHCVGDGSYQGISPAPPKDYSGTTFAYNIKDGRWWASYNSNRGFAARSDCDADSKERYDYFWCNHDTKKGRKPMIVALGYDETEQRYRMVSNANSRQTKPERILKECQSKGYARCEIVFDGSQ